MQLCAEARCALLRTTTFFDMGRPKAEALTFEGVAASAENFVVETYVLIHPEVLLILHPQSSKQPQVEQHNFVECQLIRFPLQPFANCCAIIAKEASHSHARERRVLLHCLESLSKHGLAYRSLPFCKALHLWIPTIAR